MRNRSLRPCRELREELRADDGILEEAAGAANLADFGQFRPPRCYDRLPHFGRPRILRYAQHGVPYVPVTEHRRPVAAEHEIDGSDYISVPIFLRLEYGLAVAVAAVGDVEVGETAAARVEAVYGFDDILCFHTVGAYVLHGGRTDFSGYMREVLGAPETAFRRPFAEFVEDHACADADQGAVLLLYEAYGRMEYGAREVGGEKQVAASSYMLHASLHRFEIELLQVCGAVVFQEVPAGDLHPEAVVAAQVHISCFSDHILLSIRVSLKSPSKLAIFWACLHLFSYICQNLFANEFIHNRRRAQTER